MLGAGVLNSGCSECVRDALQLRRIGAGERDVVNADAERVELVSLGHFGRRPTQSKWRAAGHEQAEIVSIHQMLEAKGVAVELFRALEIADAKRDVVYAGSLHLYRHGCCSGYG